MVQINFGQREVSCKLVYYGPGMSGKTTNLEIIHQKAPDNAKGEMVSIATETDRTLYFDYLPLDLGQVAGMHTKFQLYTVPGQIYYNATRKLVLQGVDGVIFVADSDPDKMAENIESLQNLRDNLEANGLKLDEIPLVIQYNKRDLPNASSISTLDEGMNPMRVPTVEAVARDGKGVFPTLKAISKLVIEKLNAEHAPVAQRRRTATSMSPAGGSPQQQAPQATPAQPQQATPAPPPPPAPTAPPQQQAPAPKPQQAPPQAAPQPQQRAARGRTGTPASGRGRASASGGHQRPDSNRQRHLQKAAPPKLEKRRGERQKPADTEPNLRRYKDSDSGGGGGLVGNLIVIILVLVILLIIVFVLALLDNPVGKAIRSLFPPGIQRMFIDDTGTSDEEAEPEATPPDAGNDAAAGDDTGSSYLPFHREGGRTHTITMADQRVLRIHLPRVVTDTREA